MSRDEIIATVLRNPRARIGAPPKLERGDNAKWPLELDCWIYEEACAIKGSGQATSLREACRKLAERFVGQHRQLVIARRGQCREGTTSGKIRTGGALLYERVQYHRRRMAAQGGANTLAELFS